MIKCNRRSCGRESGRRGNAKQGYDNEKTKKQLIF